MIQQSVLRQLHRVHRLVFLQHCLRLALRATWLGMAVFLLSWSLDQWLGWQTAGRWGWLVALVVSAIIFLSVFFKRPNLNTFAWRMDRRLNYREQISAGLFVSGKESLLPVENALLQDVTALLDQAYHRILKKGWRISQEVVSLVLMVLLLGMVFIHQSPFLHPAEAALLAAEQESIPPLADEPGVEEVFPDGMVGLKNQPGSGDGKDSLGNLNAAEMAALAQTVQDLGESLSQQAATYELGQALQNLDPQQAADSMEALSQSMEELSTESRQQLSEALQQASEQLSKQASSELTQELAQDLGNAADAIQQANPPADADPAAPPPSNLPELQQAAKDGMKKLAQDMREIQQQIEAMQQSSGGAASGMGSSSSTEDSPEPVERLAGTGGEQLEIKSASEAHSGLLSPQAPQGLGESTVSGSLAPGTTASGEAVNSLIIPYTYPWFWRNVVSTYFQGN